MTKNREKLDSTINGLEENQPSVRHNLVKKGFLLVLLESLDVELDKLNK